MFRGSVINEEHNGNDVIQRKADATAIENEHFASLSHKTYMVKEDR
jgi:hypothetical protein